MKRLIVAVAAAWGLLMGTAFGQVPPPGVTTIKRFPTGANVNPDGDTTVFITFGGLVATDAPGEALWCSETVTAAFPESGNTCKPGTIFGRLPARFDRSKVQGKGVFTDVMAIPASVSRRALQAAQSGHTSNFFYVRQFLDTTGGGANQYVSVTCNLIGMGASVPLSLNNVRLYFEGHKDELYYPALRDLPLPPVKADIVYNGSGRLRGRWEVVLPGELAPTDMDLTTEGSLTEAERLQQKRFTLVERFDVFLPPNGKYALKGPDPARIPKTIDGLYSLLLRVEVSNDSAGDVDLAAAGAGSGIEHHGAVADFPMPVLRYSVGSIGEGAGLQELAALSPKPDETVAGKSVAFEWSAAAGASIYRLVVKDSTDKTVLTAAVKAPATRYAAPPWLKDSATGGMLKWRVSALDKRGREIARTAWSKLQFPQ